MSGFLNLFGKVKEEKKVDVSGTIHLIKDTIHSLEKRQNFIDKNIEEERKYGKEAIAKNNKQRAMTHIKKIKMYQKEYEHIQGNILNLETQRMALENQVTSYNIVQAMKASSIALKNGPKPEEISDLMDNINDSIQDQEEIAQELSRPIGPVMDEDELQSELEMLESDYLHEISGTKKDVQLSLASLPSVKNKDILNIPDIPNILNTSDKEIKDKEKEEKELKELEMILS